MSTIMNVTDFCDKYGIKYFGISLRVGNGKKTPQYVELYKATPKMTDFKTLSEKELDERRQHASLFDYIAMDTSDYQHIDVDYKDDAQYDKMDEKYINDFAANSAYFTSLTKKRGKHIIIKTSETFNDNHRPQTKLTDVEILNGQWSYVKRNELVYNADKIYELDADDILELWDRPSPQDGGKAPKLMSSQTPKQTNVQIERPTFDNDYQSYLMELVDMLRYDDIAQYDSWTRLIWALHNDTTANNYEIAKYMSSKTSNYDEQDFNKYWYKTKSGLSMGSFIYYVKSIDERKFYKIKSKYYRKTTTIESSEMALAKVFLDISGENYVFKRGEGSSDL